MRGGVNCSTRTHLSITPGVWGENYYHDWFAPALISLVHRPHFRSFTDISFSFPHTVTLTCSWGYVEGVLLYRVPCDYSNAPVLTYQLTSTLWKPEYDSSLQESRRVIQVVKGWFHAVRYLSLDTTHACTFGIDRLVRQPQTGVNMLDVTHGVSILNVRNTHPIHLLLHTMVQLFLKGKGRNDK